MLNRSSGSTYWTKKVHRKQRYFVELNPYLTFLNIPQLERQGADMQRKVDELEALNQAMKDRDKLKDDGIAHLSDQLIALTVRLDSTEKGLKNNTDGSLDIYIQHASPGKDKESHWLPPDKNSFHLMLRMYLPAEEVLNGTWTPPPIRRQ